VMSRIAFEHGSAVLPPWFVKGRQSIQVVFLAALLRVAATQPAGFEVVGGIIDGRCCRTASGDAGTSFHVFDLQNQTGSGALAERNDECADECVTRAISDECAGFEISDRSNSFKCYLKTAPNIAAISDDTDVCHGCFALIVTTTIISVTSQTQSPTAISETNSPTSSPTTSPTLSPTVGPATAPTLSPTTSPTMSPTTSPVATTASPTTAPTPTSTVGGTGGDDGEDDTGNIVVACLVAAVAAACLVALMIRHRRRMASADLSLEDEDEFDPPTPGADAVFTVPPPPQMGPIYEDAEPTTHGGAAGAVPPPLYEEGCPVNRPERFTSYVAPTDVPGPSSYVSPDEVVAAYTTPSAVLPTSMPASPSRRESIV